MAVVSRSMKKQPQQQGDLALFQPTFRIMNHDTGSYSACYQRKKSSSHSHLSTNPTRVAYRQDRPVQ